MKKVLCISLIFALTILILPLNTINRTQNSVAVTSPNINTEKVEVENLSNLSTFKLCDSATGKITEIKTEDYLFGVVAAEMPALYHEEALKAQAVAAYTFALSRKVENADKSYDITNDHTIDQSYLTKEKAREKWGENADAYTEKIENVISETEGLIITYNGKIITSVYHAISGGKTEDANFVWSVSFPYLKPVVSEGDKLSPDYISEVSFTTNELKRKFADELEFSGEEKNYFKNITRTDSGTVKNITVCSKELTGARVRSILNLRSSNFKVNYKDGNFTFTVYGYGHGVGMSQNGANYMAKQGSSFEEILTWYYSDCKVEKNPINL